MDDEAIKMHVRERLANGKLPREIHVRTTPLPGPTDGRA